MAKGGLNEHGPGPPSFDSLDRPVGSYNKKGKLMHGIIPLIAVALEETGAGPRRLTWTNL